jgi:hypothetical protein
VTQLQTPPVIIGAHVAPELYLYPLGHPVGPCARAVIPPCGCCAVPMCGHEL